MRESLKILSSHLPLCVFRLKSLQANHGRHRKFVVHTIILSIIVSLFTTIHPFLLIYLGFQDNIYLFFYFIFFYIEALKIFYVFQFYFASLALRERFKYLNQYLESFMDQKKLKPANTLRNVRKLYLDLCDLIELVNSTYTFHLVLVLIIVLV